VPDAGDWDTLEARIEEFLDSMSVQDLFEERREPREEVGAWRRIYFDHNA